MFKQIPNMKYEINKEGEVRRVYKSCIKYLKPFLENTGYMRVALTENSKTKKYSVHRLLAITFLPNPENFPVVDHIDRVRTNNDLSNLRWCSYHTNNKNKKTKDYILYIAHETIKKKWNYTYYCVSWLDENGKRKKKRFKNEKDQLEFAETLPQIGQSPICR